MKIPIFFMLLLLALIFSLGYSQSETNGTTNDSTNSTTNDTTNGTTNGTQTDTIQCTKPCQQLSYQTCTLCSQICTNTSSGEVTSYKLTTCELKTCKLWKTQPRSQADPTNTVAVCAQWETKLLSEQQCGTNCCEETFMSFTYESLEKCIQNNNDRSSSETNTSTIIAAVLSSVLGSIVILVIVICCRQRIAICCQNFVYAIQRIFTGDYFKKSKDQASTQQSEHHHHTSTKIQKLKWETVYHKKQLSELPTSKYIIQSQYDINPQIYCSVCLDSGLNTETHCDHHFHLACLRTKMAKKFVCPQCQSKDINPLKITCDICMLKEAKFTLNKSNTDYEIPHFFVNKKIYCNECFDKNVRSGHIKQLPKA